ncbi:MAG TPA: hypothetical protein DD979_10615 [Gammaproteobacteria bacterium]|nr:hypothetical protein [Gammaproteobacteria bacterium]
MPRLSAFYNAHPDIALDIQPTSKRINTSADDYDLLIRYTDEHAPIDDHIIVKVTDAHLSPVCNAEIHAYWLQHNALPPGVPLLEDALNHGHQWRNWFRQYPSPDLLEKCSVMRFDLQSQLYEPALSGHGVALCMLEMLSNDIAQGQLHRLFPDQQLATTSQMLAIYPEDAPREAVIERFLDWMVNAAETNNPIVQKDAQ